MAGWLHGVFVGEWLFVFPLCGFSLSLFCNYICVCVYMYAGECEARGLLCLCMHDGGTPATFGSYQIMKARSSGKRVKGRSYTAEER